MASTKLTRAVKSNNSPLFILKSHFIRSMPGYLLVFPAILFAFIFAYYPFVSGILHSFTEWDGIRSTYTGLRNYYELFQDRLFLSSLMNTLKLLAAGILKTITMPLLVSELVFWLRNKRLAYFFRLVFVVPLVVPDITRILLWQHLYSFFGTFNRILELIGGPGWRVDWLGNPDIAMTSIILFDFPWVTAMAFLVYLAALQAIPDEIFDAAKIDGTNWIKRVLYIDIPIIRTQIIMLCMLTVIFSVNVFFSVMILTDGGPGFSTMVPGLYLYKSAFEHMRFGYGSAIAVGMLFISLTFTILGRKLMAE